MAVARDVAERREELVNGPGEYNFFHLSGQQFYKMVATLTSTYFVQYARMNRPWTQVGLAMNTAGNSILVRTVLEACNREHWLRNQGDGNLCKGITKEMISNTVGLVAVLGAAYASLYLSSALDDWSVSENQVLAKLAEVLTDPKTATPIYEAAAYFVFNSARGISNTLMSQCWPKNKIVVQYPDLNLLQIAATYSLRTVLGVSASKLAATYTENSHLIHLAGAGAYLADLAAQQLVYKRHPLSENIPMDDRIGLFYEQGDFTHPRHGLDVPGCGRALVDSGARATYHVFLFALIFSLAEIINAIDKENRLPNYASLAIAFAFIEGLDYVLRQATPVVSKCVSIMFPKPQQRTLADIERNNAEKFSVKEPEQPDQQSTVEATASTPLLGKQTQRKFSC